MRGTVMMDGLLFVVPTLEDVEGVRPGDEAIDCWGRMTEVVEVSYRGTDVHGRCFVGYTTRCSSGNGTISMSIKEGVLTRTVALSNRYLSRELDDIERRLLAPEL